jgi:AcrR family transcriptional regulator
VAQALKRVQSAASRPNLLAGEEVLPEPHQKRSQEKRARLKDAALALFGERGYEGTSVDDIVSRANLAMGTFYQHYRSKRQLLLALMDELLQHLSRLELRPTSTTNIRSGLHRLLAQAFSADLRYLGAYRAWQEAALADSGLASKQAEIHAWTTARLLAVFNHLQQLPDARTGVDIAPLARVMDSFFWNLLAQALRLSKPELNEWIDAATHLIYHALFRDVAANPGFRSDIRS